MAQKVAVCQADALKQGEMRQFSVGDRKVLLARFEDDFWAIAPECPHAGAALADGVMKDDRVVCPWHNACFSLRTGEMLEPPALEHLAKYPTSIEDGDVYVDFSEQGRIDAQQQDQQSVRKEQDSRTFAIIGGGAAGCAAAQMLRQMKFSGRIVLLTDSDLAPYDRTKLSKAYLQQDEAKEPDLLKHISFYERYDIELKTAAKVSKLAVKEQTITYGNGEVIQYDALLIATGSKVKKIPMDGSDLEGVFTLHQAQDARAVLEASKEAKKIVIVGSGFIGMEVASSLNQQGLEVTIVTPNAVPFEKVLGKEIGQLMMQIHESHGVKFELESKAIAFKGEGKVTSVELENGKVLPADMVVVGIGVQPATDFIEDIALDDSDKSVPVNQYLQAAPGVYAAGDIAQFPHFMTGQPVRIEHWRLAMQHGRAAARNMVGESVAFKSVPFFWTGQYDVKLRYIGHAEGWDETIVQGSIEEKDFLVFYVKEKQILAVSGIGRDKEIAAISQILGTSQMPGIESIRSQDISWSEALSAVVK